MYTISINFETGRGRPLFERRRPFYGPDVQFKPMRKIITCSDNSLVILKMDVEVHFMDGNEYFKIKFGRQSAVEQHSGGQKIQDSTVLVHTPRP